MNVICVYSKVSNLLNELIAVLPTLQFHSVLSDKDDQLTKSEIIIGDFDFLAPIFYNLSNAKWIQGTRAGVDVIFPFIQKDKPLPFIVSRYSGTKLGKTMAEYVTWAIVNHERHYETLHSRKSSKTWDRNPLTQYRLISDLSVGILGLGYVGRWIGQMLHGFGARIFGLGKSPQHKDSYLSGYHTKATLPDFLRNCDYVINTLPSTKETIGLLDGNVLKNCAVRKAVFINLGRGNVISDSELIASLNNGWISHVVLDVFNTEPLPQDSLLWEMPQVVVTPHVAALPRAKHIAEVFKENYVLYKSKQPISTTIDFAHEY